MPEDFCCGIALIAMDDPVYCEQNKTRYERSHLDSWLAKKNQHPITHEDLYWEDLIPDPKRKS
ncbi:MAG: hypothetical protein P1U74_04960 [Legionellaceae bacterium]|nr:hypothetical protein [Legionellaceae bacterium]